VRWFASFAGKQAHEKESSWRALPSKPPCWQFASGITYLAEGTRSPALSRMSCAPYFLSLFVFSLVERKNEQPKTPKKTNNLKREGAERTQAKTSSERASA
jgi:hypothetical protein